MDLRPIKMWDMHAVGEIMVPSRERVTVSVVLRHSGPSKFSMSFIAPTHWAPPATPLTADAAPPSSAPRAGGGIKEPPPPADWEWELSTVVNKVEAPPLQKDSVVCHRGGCHCGAVRFEVDAPACLTIWECNWYAQAPLRTN